MLWLFREVELSVFEENFSAGLGNKFLDVIFVAHEKHMFKNLLCENVWTFIIPCSLLFQKI